MSISGGRFWMGVVAYAAVCSSVLRAQEPTADDIRIDRISYTQYVGVLAITFHFESERFPQRILLQESLDLSTWIPGGRLCHHRWA